MKPIQRMAVGFDAVFGRLLGSNRHNVVRGAAAQTHRAEKKIVSWAEKVRQDVRSALNEAHAAREEANFESDREQAPKRVQKNLKG